MAKRTTTIDDPDLIELLEGIHSGIVALPNFQRDFDWSDGDIRKLLATVLNGWPMGSLLLIEGDAETRDFYDPRAFEFAPEIVDTPETIVLDGQQRLTSLYSALYDRSDSVHAVQFSPDLDWDDIDAVDDALRTYKRHAWDAHFPDPASQVGARLLPVSALRSTSTFFAWRDKAVAPSSPDYEELTTIYRERLAGLYRYRMPALRITRQTHPAAVARIFERVNKTGQQLGAFDLMVAKSFTPTFNLRVKWDLARRRFPELNKFYGDDGLAPLQVIALRALDDVRASAVLDLTPSSIHDYWEDAAKSLAAAVRFAREQLGVLSQEWLPYKSLAIVIAAHTWNDHVPTDDFLPLKRWFWQACLTSRYAVGSNTVAVADFKNLNSGRYRDATPFSVDWGILQESTKQSAGALHRAWLCALGASTNAGSDLDIADPNPRSLIARDVREGGEISPHLLTLGFALVGEDGERLPGQFLPADFSEDDVDLTDEARRPVFLKRRLQAAIDFVAVECLQDVALQEFSERDYEGHGD